MEHLVLGVTATDVVRALYQGIPVGAIYALIALGFVLTYKTSGVFNLAFGAQAFIAAAVHWELHQWHHWNIALSALVAIGIVSPAVGVLLDTVLFRFMRTAPSTARLIVTIGLSVALPNLAKLALRFSRHFSTPSVAFFSSSDVTYRPFGDNYPITRDELVQLAVGLIAVVGLAAMFRYTNVGLRMRAVVESPRLAELSGVNSAAIGSLSWALSSAFAGLAGV